MRNAFWLAVIGAALASIIAGFLQGALATHPPPVAQLRHVKPDAHPSPAGTQEENDLLDRTTPNVDAFSQDDVVVDRPRTARAQWQREQLALVVGICGDSIAA